MQSNAPDGRLWNGRKVADWLSEVTGTKISRYRGWEILQQLSVTHSLIVSVRWFQFLVNTFGYLHLFEPLDYHADYHQSVLHLFPLFPLIPATESFRNRLQVRDLITDKTIVNFGKNDDWVFYTKDGKTLVSGGKEGMRIY